MKYGRRALFRSGCGAALCYLSWNLFKQLPASCGLRIATGSGSSEQNAAPLIKPRFSCKFNYQTTRSAQRFQQNSIGVAYSCITPVILSCIVREVLVSCRTQKAGSCALRHCFRGSARNLISFGDKNHLCINTSIMQQTRTSHVGARSSMGQTCMPRMRPFAPHSIRQATQQLCCSTLPASAAPCTVVGRSAIAASAVAAPAMAFAPRQHRRAVVRARSAPTDNMPSPTPLVAVEGDLILVHFVCKDADGNVLESSIEADSPLSFVIGAGEMMGNKLFQVRASRRPASRQRAEVNCNSMPKAIALHSLHA